MKLDSRHLRVAEAVRLLNATPLGEVVQAHVVYRHLNRAAYQIGDGRHIDLLRYAAWLFHARCQTFAPGWTEANYEGHKEAVNARGRAQSESSRDIAAEGWVHPPLDPERRARCRDSFREFCQAYFAQTFTLAWSADHLRVIAKIETAVLEGGLFAMAMPRGSGKTTLCETACLWALIYGHRSFVALIGADEEHAQDMLGSIKSGLVNNDLLEQDFAAVCGPVRALEGIHQRAAGQLYRGARTQILWTNKQIVLPTIDGSVASGGIIKVAGITGRIRGMKFKRADGQTVRPSLVLLDDPQTDESARSPSQCATREQVLAGAILGLAGPGKKIAGLMTLTVVRPDDMADRLLDPQKHPQWQGERTQMVYAFPANEKLWQQYAQLRAESQRNGTGTATATLFYGQHQAEMDVGAQVAWPQRHNADELSAIQHAMNLKLDHGEQAFWAEYQNQPLTEKSSELLLGPEEIAQHVNGVPRRVVPIGCEHLTCYIDLSAKMLWWMVCGWARDMTGWIIDYGSYPDQKRPYYTLADSRSTLARLTRAATLEGQLYAGLEALVGELVSREWRRQDQAVMHLERVVPDANWGNSTDSVYRFCRQSPHAALLLPGHGRYVGATSAPWEQYTRKAGEFLGHHWLIPSIKNRRAIRSLHIDTNYWKSWVHGRLRLTTGDKGALTLYGHDPQVHRLLADHLTAEYPVAVVAKGRTVMEWKWRPGRPDNHFLDCLAGNAAVASLLGCQPITAGPQPVVQRRRFRGSVTYL